MDKRTDTSIYIWNMIFVWKTQDPYDNSKFNEQTAIQTQISMYAKYNQLIKVNPIGCVSVRAQLFLQPPTATHISDCEGR